MLKLIILICILALVVDGSFVRLSARRVGRSSNLHKIRKRISANGGGNTKLPFRCGDICLDLVAQSRLKLCILQSSSSPEAENNHNNTTTSEIESAPGVNEELEEKQREADRQLRQSVREGIATRIQNKKRRQLGIAIGTVLAAIGNYAYQYANPVTSLSLLVEMQRNSEDLAVIGKNGKPTVVDFWAPWCENCKASAPTLSSIESEYGSRVNFILVNGDLSENWGLIERFGVDAIPHMALVDSDGNVETALIGPMTQTVMRADLDALLLDAESKESKNGDSDRRSLPYAMYDAFQADPSLRKVSFEKK